MESRERFYGELARWWPLLSPVEDYAAEAVDLVSLLERATSPARTLLELGSGGGHLAFHLASRFALTLSDVSPEMLAVSRKLHPGVEHVVGDMRTLRLGRTFDLVLVHDAIAYMTSEADLRAALATAHAHCRPGGAVVLLPDETKERFEPETECGGSDGPDGAGARYLEWTYDPNPDDDVATTEYVFVLREADGRVRTVHETHVTGLFATARWLAALESVGFAAEAVSEAPAGDWKPRTIFIGRRDL